MLRLACSILWKIDEADFLRKLKVIGQLDGQLFGILMKVVGIGVISEIAGLICSDTGNGAMGKAIEILASGVILWVGLPLLNNLFQLIENILEAV